MNNKKQIAIIGGGIGGLTTALRLSNYGYDITLYEKNNQLGGRLNQLQKDGFLFDTGPSFFSMSYEFTELCRQCQVDIPFTFHELDPLYTVYLPNSKKPFRLYKDIDKLSEQFEGIEPHFKEKFEAYIKQCELIFHSTIDHIVKRNFNSLTDYMKQMALVNPRIIPVLTRNFWREVSRHFESHEARELLSLVAFFLGRTPFNTMGIYTLLSYTEFRHDGYYNVEGGMYRIVEGITHILRQRGVNIVLNEEIVGYSHKQGELLALHTQTGREIHADVYVINSDAVNFRHTVLHRPAYNKSVMKQKQWTMGFLTAYIGINCKLLDVEHHNYFLGNDYEHYAKNLTHNIPNKQKPYYYVNVLSKHNESCAPKGCESLFFVCPVPNLIEKPDWSDSEQLVDEMIADFSKRISFDISKHIISKTYYTPIDWQNQYNLYKGAALGLAHTMFQIGWFRAPNHDELFKNMFYVGSSTIPGAGLPMGVISSQLTTERILGYLKKQG